MEQGKSLLQSKTFWTNLVMGLASFLIPKEYGDMLSPEILASVFVVVNIVLRLISKDSVQLL